MFVISVPTTPGTGRFCVQAVGGQHVQQFVAVEEPALAIDELQPVGVAVECDAVVSAMLGARARPAPAAQWHRRRR
jgi:hypothetical protein